MRLLKLQPKAGDTLKSLSVINMNENKIIIYNELNDDEKEVIDVFRQMQ